MVAVSAHQGGGWTPSPSNRRALEPTVARRWDRCRAAAIDTSPASMYRKLQRICATAAVAVETMECVATEEDPPQSAPRATRLPLARQEAPREHSTQWGHATAAFQPKSDTSTATLLDMVTGGGGGGPMVTTHKFQHYGSRQQSQH